MASRFERVTDIDKLFALRSAGLLYCDHQALLHLLLAREITKERQEWLCSVRMLDYYVLVEEDSDEQSL